MTHFLCDYLVWVSGITGKKPAIKTVLSPCCMRGIVMQSECACHVLSPPVCTMVLFLKSRAKTNQLFCMHSFQQQQR